MANGASRLFSKEFGKILTTIIEFFESITIEIVQSGLYFLIDDICHYSCDNKTHSYVRKKIEGFFK